MNIYKISDLDRIQFSNLNNAQNRIRITDTDSNPLFMQLPSLRPTKLTTDDSGSDYELCLSTNAKTQEQSTRFTNFIANLDHMCVKTILQYKDQLHLERFKTTFDTYDNITVLSFTFDPNNRQKTKIYNENKDIVDPDTLLDMDLSLTYIRSIVELRSINIRDGEVSVEIIPHQFQLIQKEMEIPEEEPVLDQYSFLNTECEL